MKFTDIKIGKRLAIAFGLTTLMTIVLSFASYQALNKLTNHWGQFRTVSLEKFEAVDKGNSSLGDAIHHFKNYLLRGQDYDQKFMADMEAIDQAAAKYVSNHGDMNERERSALGRIKEGGAAYREALKKAVAMKTAGATIEEIDKAIKGADKEINAAFDELAKITQEETAETAREITGVASTGERTIILMAVLIIVLSVLFAWLASTSVTRPLNEAIGVAKRVAEGDLTQRIEVKSEDETGQLLQALKVMNESLSSSRAETEGMVKEVATIVEGAAMGDFSVRVDMSGKTGLFLQLGEGINRLVQTSEAGLGEVVRILGALSRGDLTERITDDYSGTFGRLKDDSNNTVEQLTQIILQIKESTDTISTAAQQITAGNSDLSQRTSEQAASLEETASSMEELTSTVRQNAENAKHANQLSMSASDIAVKGGKVVGEVVDTMASISTSSKKIVDIISVIEGIAFQTNILALNAAVEAARAGEQGRGFAVVAGEVRNLAQRSAAAAKEIKALIGDSVDKVDTGSKQVDQAGATMNEIVTAVKRVTDIMAEISAASNEQSAGIEQVNQAISQMDAVTQQNASLVEEAAAAAESMQEQAIALDVVVSTFRLDERREHAGPIIVKHVAKFVEQTPKVAAVLTKNRKLAKTKEGKDGDWKEF